MAEKIERLTLIKKQEKKIARELGYPVEVQDQIDQAESKNEITRIMINARNDYYA